MLARARSASLHGIEAAIIVVEVDVTTGLPSFTTVGLPDSTVRESRDRVRAAIKNSGFEFPAERITVNLAPADLRKEGAAFDLPTAVGILAATGLVKPDRLDRALVLGELSLDGRVCPVRGVLPVALSCRRAGFSPVVVPADNAAEAAAVGGLRVIPVATLQATVDFLNGEREPPSPPANVGRWLTAPSADAVDFADVRGHAHAKRALEIAAAGAHNVMRLGSIPNRPDSAWFSRPGPDVQRPAWRPRPTAVLESSSTRPDGGGAEVTDTCKTRRCRSRQITARDATQPQPFPLPAEPSSPREPCLPARGSPNVRQSWAMASRPGARR